MDTLRSSSSAVTPARCVLPTRLASRSRNGAATPGVIRLDDQTVGASRLDKPIGHEHFRVNRPRDVAQGRRREQRHPRTRRGGARGSRCFARCLGLGLSVPTIGLCDDPCQVASLRADSHRDPGGASSHRDGRIPGDLACGPARPRTLFARRQASGLSVGASPLSLAATGACRTPRHHGQTATPPRRRPRTALVLHPGREAEIAGRTAVDYDARPRRELAAEDLLGERVFEVLLDGPLPAAVRCIRGSQPCSARGVPWPCRSRRAPGSPAR